MKLTLVALSAFLAMACATKPLYELLELSGREVDARHAKELKGMLMGIISDHNAAQTESEVDEHLIKALYNASIEESDHPTQALEFLKALEAADRDATVSRTTIRKMASAFRRFVKATGTFTDLKKALAAGKEGSLEKALDRLTRNKEITEQVLKNLVQPGDDKGLASLKALLDTAMDTDNLVVWFAQKYFFGGDKEAALKTVCDNTLPQYREICHVLKKIEYGTQNELPVTPKYDLSALKTAIDNIKAALHEKQPKHFIENIVNDALIEAGKGHYSLDPNHWPAALFLLYALREETQEPNTGTALLCAAEYVTNHTTGASTEMAKCKALAASITSTHYCHTLSDYVLPYEQFIPSTAFNEIYDIFAEAMAHSREDAEAHQLICPEDSDFIG